MTEPVVLRDGVVIPAESVEQLISQSDTPHTVTWFTDLPAVVDDWCRRWRIRLEPELPRLSYNVVLFGQAASLGPVVLKLSPPHREFLAELEGLLASAGNGIVKVHDARPEQAGMLLERVVPGVALRDLPASYSDEDATRISAACLQRFWRPAPAELGNLITLERWFRDLFEYTALLEAGSVQGPLSLSVAQTAVAEARTMLASSDEPVVLHGDLHHDNILTNQEGGWTIIDPKGLVGDRSYDVGTWMLNPGEIHRDPQLTDLFRRRVDIFSEELRIPRQRIIGGAIVHAVLSACWSLVDGDGDEELIAQDEWLESSLICAGVMMELRGEG